MGLMVQEALKAAEELVKDGIDATVVNVSCLKPLDEEGVLNITKDFDTVFALEEHSVIGGLYSTIVELTSRTKPLKVVPIGINDTFGESGKAKDVLNKYGISAEHVVEVVKDTLK